MTNALRLVLIPCLLVVTTCSLMAVQPPGTPAFDGGKAYEHVRAMVALGPRPAGSPALEETRKYIRAQMTALGFKTEDQAFDADTPIGRIHMVNLRTTIPGTRPERLIIGGHYDTKFYRQFRFVGANDAGSSAAFLIELARVLKARKNPLTVELVFFDGEEATLPDWTGNDHTYGSRHYVETAKRTNDLARIKAMILVDMIGDRNLNIRRESYSTPWMTDIIWSEARANGYGDSFPNDTMAVEDDHMAFLQAGLPAVDIIDLDYSTYWHTPEDTLDKVSARSIEAVGRTLVAALPKIEARLLAPAR
ncbi:MAG: M28 family peptidase [Acidobacteria bacterium]|nr:M28 family peptidase [Acidobacteriota bacterium]